MPEPIDTDNMKPYIICGGSENGRAAIFGWCKNEPVPGQPVQLFNAQMVLYWSEQCGGLFGLAAAGPRSGTRITKPVRYVADKFCTQVISVSDEAAKAFAEWRCV